MNKSNILLVDDEEKLLVRLSDILEKHGYSVKTTTDGNQVIPLMAQMPIDAIILDLMIPPLDGMDVLENVIARFPLVPVIILSGHGSISKAIKAIRLGAFDFLEKPLESERVLITLENALKKSRLERERSILLQDALERYQMVGVSAAIQGIFSLIDRVALSDSRVLINGESGTGKELVAKALHFRSLRAGEPFVTINCAAIPEELIESELFGHEKGAFTGAMHRQSGKFEQASHGTLFLDEIGDMSLRIQAKVLRAIENGEIQPIGCKNAVSIDVRIIAATNCDLKEAIRNKTFREDMYYRLSVINISIPPLRERREDIPLLAQHFLDNLCRLRKRPIIKLTQAAIKKMENYSWPGNVRELRNLMEKIAILSSSEEINGEDMGMYLEELYVPQDQEQESQKKPAFGENLADIRHQSEKEAIELKLTTHHWNYEQVARALQISRATLFKKIRDYHIKRPNG